ncbi:anti-sigma factor family protein [Angustibacter luteus]|uniref:Anti-sigma factor n=1 Tax=Angustibacter luteus TaxID=658456 RepID=A0ABW1J9H3_9ACTN
MSDSYETWAGPYVLGALSPSERDEFARHLTGCPPCSEVVAELAGLPGLLSRVPASVVAELSGESGPDGEEVVPPLPDTLLPNLLREARRRRRGLVALAVAGLAAAVVGVLVAVGAATAPDHPSSPTAPTQVAGSTMQPAPGVPSSAPISATVALTKVGWGTRLDLACEYEDYGRGDTAYALVVVDRAGQVQQVGTWNAIPGKLIHMSSGTALDAADIAAVQVRTVSGRTVLNLDHPTAAVTG